MIIALCVILLIILIYWGYNYKTNNTLKQQNNKLIEEKKNNEELIEIGKNRLNDINLSIENSKIDIEKLKDHHMELMMEDNALSSRIDAMMKSLDAYKTAAGNAQTNFENQMAKMRENYQNNIDLYHKEYQTVLEESAKEYQALSSLKEEELIDLECQLEDAREKVNAAIEANKREEQKLIQENFYKINLSNEDLKEIQLLKNISLRDPEPLNKIIWKYYYEKPTTDMIGRVIGKGTHIGIYKITNVLNGKCYVGQSVSISERWKQHIKRALGAEPITKNKLYPIMNQVGPENFTFEIIEECPKEKLDEREKYWQEYFQANTFGYSIK